jgi:hypothetical protein
VACVIDVRFDQESGQVTLADPSCTASETSAPGGRPVERRYVPRRIAALVGTHSLSAFPLDLGPDIWEPDR